MLEILSLRNAEAARWQTYVDHLPFDLRDVCYTPAYARVQYHLGPVYAAVGIYGGSFVLQPFTIRDGKCLDISSFYGGGGPVTNSDFFDYREFDAEFSQWRQKNNIVCEYCQLNPLMYEHQRSLIGDAIPLEKTRDAVLVCLNYPEDELFKKFSRNRRRSIKGAQDRGVKVTRCADVKTFASMYKLSMNRLKANERWNYPDAIWRSYLLELGPERSSLFKAFLPDNTIESMLLVIHGYGKAYAHFLASNAHDSNDLLYFEAMKWCHDAGINIMSLGGGLTGAEDDPLLSYKAGFSTLRGPVYTYKRIFDGAAYSQASNGSTSDFFPAYRADNNADSAPPHPA